MKKRILGLFATLLFGFVSCGSNVKQPINPNESFNYKQVNEANALKGFLPFVGGGTAIPTSMEFFYIGLNKIWLDENKFDFSEIENNLNNIKKRGHQAVFRVYLDYPQEKSAVPDFFWENGIEKLNYTCPDDGKTYSFPDYTNQKCIDYLETFIKKLGEKYDGDSRIAFIFTGLVGHWGEWHNYYYTLNHSSEKMPTDEQMNQLFSAFADNFPNTYCLTRYPSSSGLTSLPVIGFHDDSFTEDTIDDTKSWYFMTRLKSSNLTERWKTAPIGGEFRPENQIPFMNGKKYQGYYQNYEQCVNETHCSWLLYHQAFENTNTKSQKKIAWTASKKLGYDFYCSNATVEQEENSVKVEITINNVGVAPFYYNWKPVLVLVQNDKEVQRWDSPFNDWDITSILPDSKKTFKCTINTTFELTEDSWLLLGIPNPMNGGVPLKFSNSSLNAIKKGYITISSQQNE